MPVEYRHIRTISVVPFVPEDDPNQVEPPPGTVFELEDRFPWSNLLTKAHVLTVEFDPPESGASFTFRTWEQDALTNLWVAQRGLATVSHLQRAVGRVYQNPRLFIQALGVRGVGAATEMRIRLTELGVSGAPGYGPIPVRQQQPAASLELAITHDETIQVPGAQADYVYEAIQYVVPEGYRLTVNKFLSQSGDNRVTARVSQPRVLGTYVFDTDTFTPSGNPYVEPLFGTYLEARVTTVLGNVNDNITLTITYTNQDGVPGRTAVTSFDVKKDTPPPYAIPITLQAGDYGVRSVEAVVSDKVNTGTVDIKSGVPFYYQMEHDADITYTEIPNPESVVLEAGEVLELAWSSNGGATTRRIVSALVLLEPV